MKNDTTGVYYCWAMTLDPSSGAQWGDRLELTLGDTPKPMDILWSQYFVPGNVIVLNVDLTMTSFPVTVSRMVPPLPVRHT